MYKDRFTFFLLSLSVHFNGVSTKNLFPKGRPIVLAHLPMSQFPIPLNPYNQANH